jgi:hypothetical protein
VVAAIEQRLADVERAHAGLALDRLRRRDELVPVDLVVRDVDQVATSTRGCSSR